MNPSQILEQIRSHYCSRLQSAITDFVSDGIITVQSEAVLRRADGSLATRGDPSTPARVDLITLVDGQVRDGLVIESETMPAFPQFGLNWQHQMQVEVNPFPWNACDVRIAPGHRDWTPLLQWFLGAFDPEETIEPGKDGLIGVVHSITQMPAGLWQVDFGSAPIETFEGLLDALCQCGVPHVSIGKLLE